MFVSLRELSTITRDEHERLNALSYGLIGGMQRKLPQLMHAQRTLGQDDPVQGSRVVIAKQDNMIIGWALIFPSVTYPIFSEPHVSGWNCYVFVDPKYRKQGIGTVLCDTALSYQPTARFYPSHRNYQFFNKFKEDHPDANFSRDPACYIKTTPLVAP